MNIKYMALSDGRFFGPFDTCIEAETWLTTCSSKDGRVVEVNPPINIDDLYLKDVYRKIVIIGKVSRQSYRVTQNHDDSFNGFILIRKDGEVAKYVDYNVKIKEVRESIEIDVTLP